VNLDLLARSAAADLRDSTARSLDLDDALAALVRARRRRAAARRVAVALALAATVLTTLAVVRPAADAPPADRDHPSPTPSVPITPGPTAPPVVTAPLCDPDVGLDVAAIVRPEAPDVEMRDDCLPTRRAGRYLSAAFTGMSSIVPFTVALPTGWRVRPVGTVLGVDLWSSRTGAGLTVVSEPATGRRWEDRANGADLVTALQRTPSLVVGNRRRVNHGPPLWIQVDVAAAPGAAGRGVECRLHPRCVPVLWSWYGHSDGPVVAEVPAHGTARLLVHQGMGIAIWVWDADHAGTAQPDPEVRQVVDSIDLWSSRPAVPSSTSSP
jgi:hypothetical protein